MQHRILLLIEPVCHSSYVKLVIRCLVMTSTNSQSFSTRNFISLVHLMNCHVSVCFFQLPTIHNQLKFSTVYYISILHLVPTLPLDPVLAPTIDLPPEKECRITLGNDLAEPSCESEHREFPPQFTFNQRSKCPPMVAGRSTIKFGQAVIWPITFTQPAMDYPFFKKPASTHVSTPQKVWGTPSA